MWHWLLPTLAVGLFGGRVVSEWLRPGLVPAILITTITLGVAGWFFKKRTLTVEQIPWSLLFLFSYVLYPFPDQRFAVLSLVLVGLTWLLITQTDTPFIPDTLFSRPYWIAGVITVSFFVLYVATLAPDVLPADNGEFQLVATNLGVAHPPGFPLYTMLGHLMTRIPLAISPAVKVNLLSAITSSLTLGLVYLSVQKIVRSIPAGLIATITLGTATTFWAQATTANIRSLTGLFAALAFYLLLGIGDRGSGVGNRPPSSVLRRYTALALVLTLGLTHHLSLAFMAVIFGLYMLWVDWDFVKQVRNWPRPGLAIIIGLLPLLYLPLRASSGARGASPDLATLDGFLNHFLALGFRGDFFYFIEPNLLWERLKVMGNVMTFQFELSFLIGMLLGSIWLFSHKRKRSFLLIGSFLIHSFITATYRAPQTVEYMLPAYIPAAICLGVFIGYLKEWLEETLAQLGIDVAVPTVSYQVFVALFIVGACSQGTSRWSSFRQLHQSTDTRDYAEGLLDNAPAGSVILADWHWATPLWYLQEVEGLRTDVATHFVFPDADPYGITWAKRIQAELDAGRDVIATHFDPTTYGDLPPSYPVGEAFLFSHTPISQLPAGYTPTNLTLNDTIQVLGYQLTKSTVSATYETVLTVAWQPTENCELEIGNCEWLMYSHLVGFDGGVYGQDDVTTLAQANGLSFTQFRLTPRPGALAGDYALTIGLEQDRQTVTTLTITPRSDPPYTQNPTFRPLTNSDATLVGYDWDNTLPGQTRLYLHFHTPNGYQTQTQDLPTNTFTLPPYHGAWGIPINNSQFSISNFQFYIPLTHGLTWLGTTPISQSPNLQSPISQSLASSRPIERDYTLSFRLIGYEPDGFHWAWDNLHDTIPAMGGIPTLKWIANSHVRTPHFVTIDDSATPDQTIGGLIRLYDAFTTRPVAILDERITQNHLGIPVFSDP